MNEADTRAELIDKQLDAAGWGRGGEVRVFREHRISDGEIRAGGIRAGRLKTDYVLSYKNRKLAVIEAKSNKIAVGEGVAQAKLYAQKLHLETSFAANGKEIYQICHKTGTEGKVDRFPTPEELWRKTFAESNKWMDRFNAIPLESLNRTKEARYYQESAVHNVMEAIANDKQRVLLTLATGTGKTLIAFQVAWKLFKSRWTRQKDRARQPRILFLVDRNILADQAYLAFSAFSDDALVRVTPHDIAKRGEVPKNGSVFFAIFQTFMSGGEGKPYFGEYEPDFFDLVIVDECHRGGANDESTWRGILDHFSGAVHLGLTATPKREENVDTYDYFGKPVYIYSLKEGVQDGFLTPFKVRRTQTTIDEYVYTPDDEVIDGIVEEGRVYTERDFNKTIEIEAREQKRVQDLLSYIRPNEKTIVFCANQAHAAKIRDLINQESDNAAVDYCVRVTANDGKQGDMYLNQFKDNEKTLPTILTTSKKLTTGVDVLNIRNIALLRPVNSMLEFKQIIGRGTRVFEGKHYFTIIDFVNAYHLFSDAEWDGDPIDPPIPMPPADSDHPDEPSGEYRPDDDKIAAPMLRIKLSDGRVRKIQSMTSTSLYTNGRPIGEEEYLNWLYSTINLPNLLGGVEELRAHWAIPRARDELIRKLERVGCQRDDLEKLQAHISDGRGSCDS